MEIKERPIYYCTNLKSETSSIPSTDVEDYMGEYNENYKLERYEIKTNVSDTVSMEGNVPYSPAELQGIEDYLNVIPIEHGFVQDEKAPSLEDYKRAYGELLELGLKSPEITATSLKDYMKKYDVEDNKGKAF